MGGMASAAGGIATGLGTTAAGVATGNPLWIAQGLAMVGKELATLPKQIQNWSEALVQSQFTMREWSAEVAYIAVKSDIREIVRGQASGRDTAETLDRLSGALQDFKDAWRPLKDWFTNLSNNMMAGVLGMVKDLAPEPGEIKDARRRVESTPEYQAMKQRQAQEEAESGSPLSIKGAKTRYQHQQEEEAYLKRFTSSGSPNAIFERWMRDVQDGKHLNFQTNRPQPATP
jgi:hypothetical protein